MELTDKRILFEDEDVLAVDKPSGMPSHATVDPGRDHLVAAVSRYLLGRDGEVGHLKQHHRLDVGTSGVVLFGRRPSADAALGDTFASRQAHKLYWAIVRPGGALSEAGATVELRSYLAPGKGAGGRTLTVTAGGQPAHTDVRVLDVRGAAALVEARPHTGRTHQIRVHLAEAGAPILGDTLYGGDEPDVKRLLLHAHRLQIPHPRTGEPLTVRAPPPRAFLRRFVDLPDLTQE